MVKRIPEPVRAEDDAPFEEQRRVYILPILLKALSLAALGLFLTGCPSGCQGQPRNAVHQDVDANFTDNPVGSPVAQCPVAGALVRFVDDGGNPSTTSATVKNTLEISNRVTTADLPTGFADASPDRDNFKVEVLDSSVTGSSIAATSVEVEALKPNGTAFSPRRKINVELQRVGTGNLFRSKYLRLVVDDQDNAANTAQTLLTDWDSSDESIEILGQIVKVTYTSSCGPLTSQTTVGSATRSYIKTAIHILRASAGGAGVVTTAQATTRMKKWYRRVFAQISMTPTILMIREVDPPQNVISIADSSGALATGTTTSGQPSSISFQISTSRAGVAPQVIGPYRPVAGHTPMQTANALAALIRAQPTFTVRTVQNPKLVTTHPDGSADMVVTDTGGGQVSISNLVQTDTQTVTIGRVVPGAFDGYQNNNGNWIVGTLMQRTVLQNYDTGSDRIDICVVGAFTAASFARGQSLIPGSVLPHYPQVGVSEIKCSAFVNSNTMDGTDADCYNTPHETVHVLLNANHTTDATQLIMGSGTTMTNIVGGSKRFSESSLPFDFPATSYVQEQQIRSQSAGLLAPFP